MENEDSSSDKEMIDEEIEIIEDAIPEEELIREENQEDLSEESSEEDDDDGVAPFDVSRFPSLQPHLLFEQHKDSIYCCAVDPSCTYCCTGAGDDRALVWDVNNGSVCFEIDGFTDSVSGVGFSFDGAYVAAASLDKTVRVWNMQTRTLHKVLSGPDGALEFLQWHQSNLALIVGSADYSCWVYHGGIGAVVCQFYGHSGSVLCGCFTVDGSKILTGSEDGTVKLWDPIKKTCISTFQRFIKEENPPVTTVCCNRDSTLVVFGSVDGSVTIGTISTGKIVSSIQAHSNSIEGLAFSYLPKEYILSGGSDRYVRAYDPTNNLQQRFSLRCPGRVTRVLTLQGSPGLLVCLSTGVVFVLDVRTGQPIMVLCGNDQPVLDCAVGLSGKLCVTCGDNQKAVVHKIL